MCATWVPLSQFVIQTQEKQKAKPPAAGDATAIGPVATATAKGEEATTGVVGVAGAILAAGFGRGLM